VVRALVIPTLVVVAGCSLDFARFEGAIDASGGDAGVHADGAADVGAPEAGDGAPVTDGPGTGADACSSAQTCVTQATTCGTACGQTSQQCQGNCMNNGCRQACRQTEQSCRMSCAGACASCAAGCSAAQGCQMASGA